MGMTQGDFADLFGVDNGTVSRWERGKLSPHPGAWKRIREIATCADYTLKASPVIKFAARMDDLTHPCLVSRGLEVALKRVGISPPELFKGDTWPDMARTHRNYPISGARVLDMVQADPRWLEGSIVYVEAHCMSVTLGVWANFILAPIPDRDEAVLELAADSREDPAAGGFWVNFVTAADLLRHPPSPAKRRAIAGRSG
jgi:transcriptional regulator with XRE-family HTH domain